MGLGCVGEASWRKGGDGSREVERRCLSRLRLLLRYHPHCFLVALEAGHLRSGAVGVGFGEASLPDVQTATSPCAPVASLQRQADVSSS